VILAAKGAKTDHSIKSYECLKLECFHLPIAKNRVPHDFTALYLLLGNESAQLFPIRPLHIVPDYIYLARRWYLSRNSKEDIHWFVNITRKKHQKNALFERRVQPILLYMAYVALNNKRLCTKLLAFERFLILLAQTVVIGVTICEIVHHSKSQR
jgi:hypothetical protein